MPTWGKAAAITALPQPAKVSQKVPIPSARYLRRSMGVLLGLGPQPLSAGAMAVRLRHLRASAGGCTVSPVLRFLAGSGLMTAKRDLLQEWASTSQVTSWRSF